MHDFDFDFNLISVSSILLFLDLSLDLSISLDLCFSRTILFSTFANNINLCGLVTGKPCPGSPPFAPSPFVPPSTISSPITGKSCPGSPPFAPSPFVPPSTISSPSLGKYYAVCANVESQVEIQCLTPRSKSRDMSSTFQMVPGQLIAFVYHMMMEAPNKIISHWNLGTKLNFSGVDPCTQNATWAPDSANPQIACHCAGTTCHVTRLSVITKETPNLLSRNTPIDEFPAALQGLYDTVFDVDNDKERAEAQGLEPNGFSFDGADAAGVDYAINRKGRFSPSKLKGKRVIELGAGCGVAGFGMALLGCDVVSTDQTEVLPLLMRNCERNASRIMQMNPGSDSFGSIQVAELSWGNVDQIKAVDPPFDYIIGTDVTMLALSGPKTTILVQYLSSSSSSNGGQIGATTEGNHLSLSMSNNQQRPFINPPQLFATAAASSGFPQQITTGPQNWLH
ncbi:hypothetical protein TEA_026205 [Camellia sinensis var. sinensis]|uniref:Uncharacterized protein n=1 Tax=Camellia sinensis var. sinensis TaxID=542762 RepID=A0A4S4F1I8_CAMSN|nr:hypothetical protein TEA_026205 [Camellia sinensis var. sinensis]